MHEFFEEQARRGPGNTALICGDNNWSYAELNRDANCLANYLIEFGVKPDDRVAICAGRDKALVIGLLAVLKAGGAYVPLDPKYPPDRLAFMLADCTPTAVLVDGDTNSLVAEILARPELVGQSDDSDWGDSFGAGNKLAISAKTVAINLESDGALWSQYPADNPDRKALGLTARNLAYVIYTSGSTGAPKGVQVEHRGVVNLLCSLGDVIKVSHSDRLLSVTTVSFDIAALEIFLPLSKGACLVLAKQTDVLNPNTLWECIATKDITLMQATPVMWQSLLDARSDTAPNLRAICGGDVLTRDLAAAVANRVRTLWNVYGPTEATIWSSFKQISGSELRDKSVPIGSPVSNTMLYVLDENGLPVPTGVMGELYIGGVGVARGYLNRPELTAERFLKDPFSSLSDARMYRTGDLGRYLPNGDVEFVGRKDDQVKIRGFRVELGEIEAHLREHECVKDVVVVLNRTVAGQGHLGHVGLIAYVVCTGHADNIADDRELDVAAMLRSHLVSRLPDYMVPVGYVLLRNLPLTPNGKVNRKALPSPGSHAYIRADYEKSESEKESLLAGLWEELLDVERVSRHDNFFQLGGHSLIAMRLVGRLQQLNYSAKVQELFRSPTLAAFANTISAIK
ncbi:non-ribosomal peptide synthetase [Agrobacterium deltaense]|uniref:non-ribosomal peptide synthetase n=1 Tax=Agrobacterium deltaense TaxID=1183412 RepID=UPI0032AEFB93